MWRGFWHFPREPFFSGRAGIDAHAPAFDTPLK
jgi:hypothetical protein